MGASDVEYIQRLEEVLHRLQADVIRMKHKKCLFFRNVVVYWASSGCIRNVSFTRKNRSSKKGSSATKHRAVANNFRNAALLLEVLAELIYHPLHEVHLKDKKWLWLTQCSQTIKTARQL